MASAGFPPEAPCLPGRDHPEFRRHCLRGGRDGGSRPFVHRAEADGCHPGSDPEGLHEDRRNPEQQAEETPGIQDA